MYNLTTNSCYVKIKIIHSGRVNMESFVMAARVVMPMALMMSVGILLRVVKIADPATMKKMDTITFKVFSPCLVFYNIYNTDFSTLSNLGYLLYGIFGLCVVFAGCMALVPKFIPERPTAAAFSQSLVRPNFIIFGAAVAQSIYGEGNIGLVMLMGAFAIPVYNVMAAVILESGRGAKSNPFQFLKAVLRNPIILATFLGIAVNLSGLRIPELIDGVIADLGGITTPLSFVSIGVGLGVAAASRKKLISSALLLRLILIPLVILSGAVMLGFRGAELCGLMILFAAPAAVASYPAAVAMGADGDFAGQMVAYSTIACLPTIFLWTLVLNTLQLL